MTEQIERSAYEAHTEYRIYVQKVGDEVVAFEHDSEYLGRGENAAEAIEDYALAVRATADGGDT